MTGPVAARLPDGRLHLQHGPIDLIVEAFGPGAGDAERRSAARFRTILEELVEELPALRRPARSELKGPTARRMAAAVNRFEGVFVTPMAAVAGAVADEILNALTPADITRAYVNNGGDVAFHLTPGEAVEAASPTGPIVIAFEDRPRGLATSGWRGRSHSLGIADAVTVAARNAASADVAATLIANAVDLPGHPAIRRERATDLAPDSDLGDRLVTTDVGPLSDAEIDQALGRGAARAQAYADRNFIDQATLTLAGRTLHIARKTLIHA